MTFVSYAQNFEDVLLNRVFGGQGTGFYVDVGAYHPVTGSVTKSFYDKGWSGINVEPGLVFADLEAARPRDVNLRMAVFDRAGEIAFVEDEADRGMSRVVMDESGGRAADGGAARMVPCDTLQAIVDAHSRGRPVDFIKVDAEGAEAAIVHSTDWRRLRPRVLLLEATQPWSNQLANQDWEPALLQQGYVRAYFDGINCFYIPEEEAPTLLRHFQVPVNVLDRAERHDNELARAALSTREVEAARLTAERDMLRMALDERQADLAARLTAERDALRMALNERQADLARLTASRDAEQAEAARLVAERDTARTELDAKFAEARWLAEQVRTLEARLAPPPATAVVIAPPPRVHKRFARRAAKTAYRLVRPVVRPVLWRLRTFMTGDLVGQIGRLDQRVEALAATPQAGQIVVSSATGQPTMVQVRDDGAAAEMRRLAAEMERTLLTLALERAPEPWRAVPPAPAAETQLAYESAPGPEPARVALLLPNGRTTEVACRPGDLSVAAPLAASGGDWEPHVRRYLEGLVQPDWVCLDIGANLGTHTLSLAVLAYDGRVAAFEADAANFALLSRNAAALAPPRAAIAPVHLALWDRPGTLVFGGADELAGCSFVAEDLDAERVERQLRTVVDAGAIAGVDLHIRGGAIAALPLDAWADGQDLPRLDLIKLDVEGAEARVIRGADATLRRFRPVLLVEYNPACAAAYFGQPPEALYEELAQRFATINGLESDGSLTPLPDWPALQARLAGGKGWEDLVCLPDRPARGGTAREGAVGPARTVAPLPPPPSPAPAASPRAGTLAELDALNAEYAERPVSERVHAVGQFLLGVEELPLDDAGDPFGPEYLERATRFWATISGRADYNPQRDELAPYVDPATSLLSPSFYASGESRYAGEFLAGMGFILQQLDIRAGDSLLEYGAGEGQIALHVARLRCHVAVIDVEQRYLDGIALQARAIGVEIAMRQGLFGDGFEDGRRFDRILFFEAFHHALDHASMLRQLHDRLKPDGRVVFACEPVILPDGPWTHVVPYPWGPRLDGLSVNAMRIHGWCELGFREDYFVELLLRSGYLCTFHPCTATPIGSCYVARPHCGHINMGEPFLIRVTGRDAGWHSPESDQRWTMAHAILPLDNVAAANGIVVDFFNFLPFERTVTVRLGSNQETICFSPGERREVRFDVPHDAVWLEILSQTDCLASYVGDHDQRVVGIGVRTVTYAGSDPN